MSNSLYPTSSLTQVANLALHVIGHNRVQNIDTPTQEWEYTIRDVIFDVIKEEQIDFYWPELKREVTLQKSTEQPLNDTYTQYNLPTDFLQLIRILGNSSWIRYGDKIRVDDVLTNSAPILEYIKYSDNPSEWSPTLRECIYTHLAKAIAMPITQNTKVYNLANESYIRACGKRDRAFKSSHSPIRRRRGTDWNRARYKHNVYDNYYDKTRSDYFRP